MSSAGYAKPLSIEPEPSRLLAGAVVFLHGGALLMIPPLPLPAWLIVVLMFAVAISWVRVFAGPVLMRRGAAIVCVQWRADGVWLLRRRDGGEQEAVLMADSYAHPWLTVLNFTGEWRCSVVLLPDSIDPEVFRRLRVRLRLEGTAATGSGPG